VSQAGAVQLSQDELLNGFRSQAGQNHRVGDAGADFLVDGQGEGLQERGLSDQNQIVRMWKVFAKQAEFAQTLRGHEMGVVDDGDEHLARAMDFEGFLDEEASRTKRNRE